MSEGLTAKVSRFVSGTPLGAVPPEAVLRAKHSILDGFGLAVAGARTEGVAIAAAEVAVSGSVTPKTKLSPDPLRAWPAGGCGPG
jgi:2-methylcitrate dehydratase PrpD